jgi:tetratricopeptide (TPR) repeat protein
MGGKQTAAGDTAAAAASLREAVQAAPEFAEAWYQLGLALAAAPGASSEAEDALLRAIQLEPGHARARFEWARRVAARGDTVAALDQLARAVELQPSLVDAHRERARLSLAASDWAAAAESLRAAIAWGADEPSVHADLARALEGLGRTEEAARERALASGGAR